MGKNKTAEKFAYSNFENKKHQNAKRSLNNYVNQLKMHFDLSEKEIVKILYSVFKTHKDNIQKKKWWQIWR